MNRVTRAGFLALVFLFGAQEARCAGGALTPEERATVGIHRLAAFSVRRYLLVKGSWNLEDFVKSDFNLLEDVPNPYTGAPIRWGSTAPGDLEAFVDGKYLVIRVFWDWPPPTKRARRRVERVTVHGSPERGWYLEGGVLMYGPGGETIRSDEWVAREDLLELRGPDRRWYLLCEWLGVLASQGPGWVEEHRETFTGDLSGFWWWIPPGLRNPYTGEPLRVGTEPKPASMALALDWGSNRAYVFCWDREGRDIRKNDHLVRRLFGQKGA